MRLKESWLINRHCGGSLPTIHSLERFKLPRYSKGRSKSPRRPPYSRVLKHLLQYYWALFKTKTIFSTNQCRQTSRATLSSQTQLSTTPSCPALRSSSRHLHFYRKPRSSTHRTKYLGSTLTWRNHLLMKSGRAHASLQMISPILLLRPQTTTLLVEVYWAIFFRP